MNIGYFADGPWSHLALEKISQDDRFEIAFIVPRYEMQDPVLKDWAKKLGVDFLPIKQVNHPEVINRLKRYGADIFVSMSFNQILKKPILSVPSKGVINCHAGALPFYRGRNILNWALINDEKTFGVTVHYVDEGIDTGDIIRQQLAPITDQDDYASLLDRAIILCADQLFLALSDIEKQSTTITPQATIDSVGSYYRKRGHGDEWINWNWDSRRIFNFIRAITSPGPCARSLIDNRLIMIKKASIVENIQSNKGIPGEIIKKNDNSFLVKTSDSVIKIHFEDIVPEIYSEENFNKEDYFRTIVSGNRFMAKKLSNF